MHVLCGDLLEIILGNCNSSENITMIVITMIAIVVRIFKSRQWNSIYGRSSSNEVHRFYYITRCRDSSPKMTPSLELPHWWCENNLNQSLNILFWLLKIDTARFFFYLYLWNIIVCIFCWCYILPFLFCSDHGSQSVTFVRTSRQRQGGMETDFRKKKDQYLATQN